MHTANKLRYKVLLDAFAHPGHESEAALEAVFAPDARINVVHPFNRLDGPHEYQARVLRPLAKSFAGLHRRDAIVMGGDFEGSDWVSSTGTWAGHFQSDWLGIRATGALAFLRVGEFHRFEGGRIAESFIYLDIPELMIACGQWPIADSPGKDRGYCGAIPGPATQDGLLFSAQDVAESEKSMTIVSDMLQGLATPDEAWRPYWHDNMMWYGPGAFGSFVGIEQFAGFQVPFENAFENWRGGSVAGAPTRHFTRFGDGAYTCSGGWPSLSGTQVKPFLDQPATGQQLFMRVCDWWRREDDLLIENWVMVDIPDVLKQMGYDLFEDIGARIP